MKCISLCFLFTSYTSVAQMASSETKIYMMGYNVVVFWIIRGEAKKYFTCVNISLHWGLQSNLKPFFSNWMTNFVFSTSFDKNQDSAMSLPTSLYISFKFLGLLISMMALHLWELTSMPLWVIMKSMTFPPFTFKTRFSGFNLMLFSISTTRFH